MKRYIYTIVFFILICSKSIVCAKNIINFDTDLNTGYSAILYDNTNGLPVSATNAIAQTSEGFIWIGNYSGLVRYDGNSFERIDSTSGIVSVMSLYVDSQDRLWIGTNDNGIGLMKNGEIRLFRKSDGLNSLAIHTIIEDNNGMMYFGTTKGIVTIDNDMNVSAINDSKISTAYIINLYSDMNGMIYGITIDGDVFTLKNGQLVNFYTSKNVGISGIISLIPDSNNLGYIYIGADSSTIYYGKLEDSFKIEKEISIAPLSYIKNMSIIDNEVWVCTNDGIGILENNVIHKLDNIPLNNSIDHMMVDYQGNVWFTSSRQGLMKIVPNQFDDIFEKFKISSQVVNSTCAYEDMLLIGTDNGLFAINDEKVIEKLPVKKFETASGKKLYFNDLIKMMDNCRIRSVIRDSQNNIWISTWKKYGLVKYNGEDVICFDTDDGLPSNRIRAVSECKDGSILVACTGGVAVIKNDKVINVYGEKYGIENTEVLNCIETENGDIIIGTDGDGIYIINDNKFIHLNGDNGLLSEVIMRIKYDKKRNIFWLITGNSLAYMTNDYAITTVTKFPYSNIFDLYESSNEKIWVLSSNGIYVDSKDNLIKNENISTAYYGKSNGLQHIATANSYSELKDNGDLYIAGSDGVSKVNIEKDFESINNIKMAVPYVVADDKTIYPNDDGDFIISSDVNKLTIYSFVYTYSLMNPQVTYKLEGFETKETTVDRSDLTPISYTNLKGGKYNFVIRLSNLTSDDKTELIVHIEKQKAFYEETWFNIVLLLLIILIIDAIVRIYILLKVRKYKRKEKEDRILIRGITKAFAKTIDMKDKYTNGHSFRVAEYTAKLAKELGYNDETVEKYYNIALLHDIGKIGVPEEVLNKNGKLTDEEYETIKSHTTLGYEALKEITVMPELRVGAGMHHERPDGKGYPSGLTLDKIPRVAQIIAVADTFDAMYSNRPYRYRMNFEKAVSIIKESAGTQLTSDVVDAFLRLVAKGEFRAPDDNGGGTTENITNLREDI